MSDSCSWYEPACAFGWIKDELKAFFIFVYDSILGGLAALVELIPVPDFLANIQPLVLSGSLSWFLNPFEIKYGLTAITSAYVARFILRRIPGIG